jgi:hypothetical protein
MKEKITGVLFILFVVYMMYEFIHPYLAIAFLFLVGVAIVCAINENNDKLNKKEKNICKTMSDVF